MSVTPTAGCPAPECKADLNPDCTFLHHPENSSILTTDFTTGPAPLALKDPSGQIGGCKSACFANLDGNPQNSANCCSGSHNVPATCPPSGVQYYDYFSMFKLSVAFDLTTYSCCSPIFICCRETLSELIRLRLRRVEQDGFVDVRLRQKRRLHHRILSLIGYGYRVAAHHVGYAIRFRNAWIRCKVGH